MGLILTAILRPIYVFLVSWNVRLLLPFQTRQIIADKWLIGLTSNRFSAGIIKFHCVNKNNDEQSAIFKCHLCYPMWRTVKLEYQLRCLHAQQNQTFLTVCKNLVRLRYTQVIARHGLN